jgi:hypothetical protein
MNESKAPPELLESAAELIKRAMNQLSNKRTKCKCCGFNVLDDATEARVHERLLQIPDRLVEMADRLRNDARGVKE